MHILKQKKHQHVRLELHWFHEGDNMQKFINVDPSMEPGQVSKVWY
jgi:ribosomal protein L21E